MAEGSFFQDLAVVMSIAGLAGVIFGRLGWPKVFGYILVGILMNGHTWGGAFLTDAKSISTISELGVVFLMFAMGLEFSMSDMKSIKGVTLPTALIDTIVMVWLGYTVGTRILGWKVMPSLFLGAAICDSATTLLAKMIGELGWGHRPFVKYVMGTSVCEDIVCVGLLALITGFAKGVGISLSAVGMSMGGLLLFFLATLVFGLILVPRLFKSIVRRKDDETLLLAALGVCFFVAYVAYRLDYSLAIGAFLVGILGASSEAKYKILQLIQPLKTMFAAMFFVSVGLLVDPFACWANVGTILLLSVVVVVGKAANCCCGALLTGQPVKVAVQMGLSLAQIGEFAFMVALLYVNLTGDLHSSLFQTSVGVALLTTLLNPLLIRLSEPAGDWAELHCPKWLRKTLDTYWAFRQRYRAARDADAARRKVRVALIELGILAVLELAMNIVLNLLYQVDWSRFSTHMERYDQYIFLGLANAFSACLIAPLMRITRTLVGSLNMIVVGPGRGRWQSLMRYLVSLVTHVAVYGGFVIEVLMIDSAVLPNRPEAKWLMFLGLVILCLVGWRFFKAVGLKAKKRIDEALETDARLSKLGDMMTIVVPQNALNRFTLGPDSPAIGETVVTLNIRVKTGASIIAVERKGKETGNIGPDWTFQVGDTLVAVGDDAQIAALKALLNS